MDVWEFLARSEWPALLAFGVWYFREPIKGMAKDVVVRKVDVLGVKAEFDRKLDKAEALTITGTLGLTEDFDKVTASARISGEGGLTAADDRLIVRSGTSPDAQVLLDWKSLLDTLRQIVEAKHPDAPLHDFTRQLSQAAHIAGLSDDEVAALVELQVLRDSVVHQDLRITWQEADQFRGIVNRLLSRLLL